MVGASPDLSRSKSGSNRRNQYAKQKSATTNVEKYSALNKLSAAAAEGPRRNTIQPPENRDFNIDKNTFYIKTIQFYDNMGQPIGLPILTEQIFGDFDDYRLQDTSYVKHENKIFFFKRIFNFNAKKNGSSLQENLPIKDLAESKLQLFCFDLATEKQP